MKILHMRSSIIKDRLRLKTDSRALEAVPLRIRIRLRLPARTSPKILGKIQMKDIPAWIPLSFCQLLLSDQKNTFKLTRNLPQLMNAKTQTVNFIQLLANRRRIVTKMSLPIGILIRRRRSSCKSKKKASFCDKRIWKTSKNNGRCFS